MSTRAPLKGVKENLVTTELGPPTGICLQVSHRQGSPPGVGSGLRPHEAAGAGKRGRFWPRGKWARHWGEGAVARTSTP